MAQAINPKVSQAQIRLANEVKSELKKIYDATIELANQYGYRFKPSESRLGWFEVIDGNDKTVSIICPVGMVDPINLCRQWVEGSVTRVKDIKTYSEAWQLIPYEFTCEPIHEQQRNLVRAQEIQEQMNVIRKEVQDLERKLEIKNSALESLGFQLASM